jgi:hypothetical protein
MLFFGNGEVLSAGIYSIAGATSTEGGHSILMVQETQKLFCHSGFSFFSRNSYKMVLLNGAKACNVFWVIEGAASIEA